jgi:hypothetical protein
LRCGNAGKVPGWRNREIQNRSKKAGNNETNTPAISGRRSISFRLKIDMRLSSTGGGQYFALLCSPDNRLNRSYDVLDFVRRKIGIERERENPWI